VFTVTDKHGRHITDLKQSDFRVVDDKKPVEEVRSFHNETNLPLQVGLLIDASNSVRDRFKFEQQAAIEFLNQTVRPRYDLAAVIGFDDTPDVTQDFTDNTEALARGVRELRPGGGTALFDALFYTCRDKLMKVPQTGPTRRAIILVSDGDDTHSHVTREEAIEWNQGHGRQSIGAHCRRHRGASILSISNARRGQRICRNPTGVAQPVCALIQAGRL
jgi:VWFA-related protein